MRRKKREPSTPLLGANETGPLGVMLTVDIPPGPWPPTSQTEYGRVRRPGLELGFAFTERGTPLIECMGEHGTVSREFQRLDLNPPTAIICAIEWTADRVQLFVNSQELQGPDAAPLRFERAEFWCPRIPLRRTYPKLDPSRVDNTTHRHFLDTVRDLDIKASNPNDKYGLKRASGLLRELIVDGLPLVVLANRDFGFKLQFEIVEPLPVRGLAGVMVNANPVDPGRHLGAPVTMVDRDALLASPVVASDSNRNATIRDVISEFANKRGGVHHDALDGDENSTLTEYERTFQSANSDVALAALAEVASVVLRGLAPLVNAILRGDDHAARVYGAWRRPVASLGPWLSLYWPPL